MGKRRDIGWGTGQLGKLLDTIDATAARTKLDGCTHVALAEDLASLAADLDAELQPALSFIAETASDSCKREIVELASTRLAVAQLCDRLIAAIDNNEMFDFTEIDATLEKLLFPPDHDMEPSGNCDVADPNAAAPTGSLDDSGYESAECDDPDLLREFLHDAKEHLDSAELLLLSLESDTANSEAINGLFRAVHSVKGSSGIVDLDTLGEVSHLAESVLSKVRDGNLELQNGVFEIILLGVDFLKQQVDSLHDCFNTKQPLRSPLPPNKLTSCLASAVRSGAVPENEIAEVRQALRAVDSQQLEEKASQSTSRTSGTMRVDGNRLEQLINLIGELVITECGVRQELEDLKNLRSSSLATRLSKVVREVQELSLSLKMVPIGDALHKMNRMVRDLSNKLQKPCRLLIEGGDTEVDKTLLECITDPLVHLIRNAIDHGIEDDSDERIEAGKAEIATILVSAEHRGGSILITIEDDGRGLDRGKILNSAMKKHIVAEGAVLTPKEIDHLIFEPGFSTADAVSHVSGRGVGMDVVRQNIESMRGNIDVDSEPGSGTQVRIELPLTLSIIDGTVVRVGERKFIIPTLSVIEQVQASSLESTTTSNGTMLHLRGSFMPWHRLGDLVGTEHHDDGKATDVCMIVESGQRQNALIVNEVVGQQPIVIKPLGAIMDAFDLFAGGALLTGGDVAFVLDLNHLFKPLTVGEQKEW